MTAVTLRNANDEDCKTTEKLESAQDTTDDPDVLEEEIYEPEIGLQ